jgi:alkylation response protein AidB-like acyl-CoA dehydrogenase
MAAGDRAEHEEAFRAGLRQFLAGHHPGRPPKDPRERLAWTKAWLATLFDNGYAGPGWPRELGGMGLSFAQQASTIGAGTRESS